LAAGGASRGAEESGLLLEGLRGRIQGRLQALEFGAVTGHLADEGRFRLGIARRFGQDPAPVDERDPIRRGPGRRLLGHEGNYTQDQPEDQGDGTPDSDRLHAALRRKVRTHAQKKLPTLKWSCHPGSGLPWASTRSK